MRRVLAAAAVAALFLVPLTAQQTGLTDAQIKQAELEMPQLVQLLELKPGMTVGDVGAGFGAWTTRLSRFLGPGGRVYANDVGDTQLAWLRGSLEREKLTNVTVVGGAPRATNLPANCCDAILVRDAYHHFTSPDDMVKSLAASLKPGGRLAVIDFPPRPKSDIPEGVPANRLGHGVPPEVIVKEMTAGGLTHVRTISTWIPEGTQAQLFLVLFRKK
jgi:ubiquinone/menaquinone biosynthesis C-methylase UbiE